MPPPVPSLGPSADLREVVQKILSGARAAVLLRLAAQTFSWVSTFIVVRFISQHDYGLNTMLEAPMELMLLVSTLGLDVALVQSKKLGEQTLRSTFGWLLLLNLALFLAYFFGGPLLAAYFREPGLDALAKTLAFVFLLVPFRVIPNAQLDRALKFKVRAQIELVSAVAAAILTLVLAVAGAGVWALVAGTLANRALQAAILMIRQPWWIRPAFDLRIVRGLIAFGGAAAAASAASLLAAKSVHFIAGPALGAAQLGLFALSIQFAMLPLAKLMPVIAQTLLPAFAKFQDERPLAAHYLEKSLGIASLALFPVMIGMACVADLFVAVVLGPNWTGAALPLALLSLIMPLRMITLFLRPVMIGMGRADLALKSSLTLLALVPPLAAVGVEYGVMGLVGAWLIAEPLVAMNAVRLSRGALPLSPAGLVRGLFPALASAAVMAATVLGVRAGAGLEADPAGLAAAVLAGAASYVGALRVLFPAQMKEALRVVRGRRGAGTVK